MRRRPLRRLFPLVTLAAASCGGAEPVVREVVASSGTIRLGEVWEADGDTIVGLPEGSIAGVGPAAVYRTRAGVVKRIWMNYPQSADFARMVGEYRGRFGDPARHDRPADPELPEILAWEDNRTRFELVRDPRRSVSTVYAVLSDRSSTESP